MSEAEFFHRIRPLFGGRLSQSQVDGTKVLLGATQGLPIEHRAYILATAYHETAHTMQPVRETMASTDAQAISRLDAAWSKGQLKWVKQPYWRRDADGKAWFGRGYVQLTHKINYSRAGQEIGLALVGDPSLALRPEVSAAIIVRGMRNGWFTGKKLSDYLPGDYVNARRIVNGTDRAVQIAGYARSFENALRAHPDGVVVPGLHDPVKTTSRPLGALLAFVAILAAAAYYFFLKG